MYLPVDVLKEEKENSLVDGLEPTASADSISSREGASRDTLCEIVSTRNRVRESSPKVHHV